MTRILIIATYFGELPPYSRLFFESARRNPSIDFLFYSDCDLSAEASENFRFVRLSFEDYKSKIESALQVPLNADRPYKLCDVRPMTGTVHREDIDGYDFFGWCDIDVLFGNIRDFYSEDILQRYHVLATRDDKTSGHLTLLKNTRRNRKLHKYCPRWKSILCDPKNCLFDEVGLTRALRMTYFDRLNDRLGGKLSNPIARKITAAKRSKLYLKEQFTTPFTDEAVWFDGSIGIEHPSTWYYRKGDVTNERDGDRRFIYLHLMNFIKGAKVDNGVINPWPSDGEYCKASPDDMEEGIQIDLDGIHPIISNRGD